MFPERRVFKRSKQGRLRGIYPLLSLVLLLFLALLWANGKGLVGGGPVTHVHKEKEPRSGIDQAPPNLTLVFSGDVMLGRQVSRVMKQRGGFYPFERVAPWLQAGDLTFGNLECPLSSRGAPLPGKGIWFRGEPEDAVTLREAGYDLLSIANNHTLDYDSPAFLDTIGFLKEQGIDPVGGGRDSGAASKPVIRRVGKTRVAYLAATEMADIFWSYQYPRTLEAKPDQPGVWKLDREQLVKAVRSLRGQADLIVVSLHWGTEFADYPTAEQQATAHALVNAGADLIIGHHPHCLQGLEYYRGGVIAYSLGNFVYDRQTRSKSQEGLLMKAVYSDHRLQKLILYPVLISQEQALIANGRDAGRILERAATLSQELGTSLVVAGTVGELKL